MLSQRGSKVVVLKLDLDGRGSVGRRNSGQDAEGREGRRRRHASTTANERDDLVAPRGSSLARGGHRSPERHPTVMMQQRRRASLRFDHSRPSHLLRPHNHHLGQRLGTLASSSGDTTGGSNGFIRSFVLNATAPGVAAFTCWWFSCDLVRPRGVTDDRNAESNIKNLGNHSGSRNTSDSYAMSRSRSSGLGGRVILDSDPEHTARNGARRHHWGQACTASDFRGDDRRSTTGGSSTSKGSESQSSPTSPLERAVQRAEAEAAASLPGGSIDGDDDHAMDQTLRAWSVEPGDGLILTVALGAAGGKVGGYSGVPAFDLALVRHFQSELRPAA